MSTTSDEKNPVHKAKGTAGSCAMHQSDSGNERVHQLLSWTGSFLVALGAGILMLQFYPVILEELRYLMRTPEDRAALVQGTGAAGTMSPASGTATASASAPEAAGSRRIIRPVNEDFGIVIPRIGANAPVVPDVDPFTESVYQQALTRGVAHAAGTAKPGEPGLIYLFAHSATDFLLASRYNAVFYLLYKLEDGDRVYLFHKGASYRYRVLRKETVPDTAIELLTSTRRDYDLALMTCWPAGTTVSRLVVYARLEPGG